MAKANINAKARALLQHDYCSPENMETNAKGTKNYLTSPSKPPAPQKKQKGEESTFAGARAEDASNAAILAAIGTLQNMMEDFKKEQKQNTLTMASIAKAVEFNSAEIKECKEKNKELGIEVKQLKKKNTELEMRAAELERYKRRWNLRLNGLKEEKEENTSHHQGHHQKDCATLEGEHGLHHRLCASSRTIQRRPSSPDHHAVHWKTLQR